jgi:hypothetical protein
MVNVPVFAPTVPGLKVTDSVQVAFGARVTQLPEVEKSVLATILEIVIVAVPVLRNVTSLDVLVVPTA